MAGEHDREQVAPAYYRGRRKTLKIDAALLIDIFKMCDEQGQLGELQEMLRKNNSVLTVETALANEVKKLFFEKALHTRSDVAASVTGYRDPKCADPYRCKYARR